MASVIQTPSPGEHLVRHRGDTLRFLLRANGAGPGSAWVRTNIGYARIRRREIIDHGEHNRPFLARDWHDIPMRRLDDGSYVANLPLVEVGRFEAKAFFLPDGHHEPVWEDGANTVVKVEPAEYVCAASIYTAFVRQFGASRSPRPPSVLENQSVETLEQAGYTVIPESGKFRDLIGELDFILNVLRFRIVQLLPIHPTPTTYARMGRFGSPFAALDLLDVDPALAEFDRRTTPLDQFKELADAVHTRRGRVFLDIPANHTGWASRLQIDHPEWFARKADHVFQSPGAWGVTWEDLSELDYTHRGLWMYMADMFLFWCRQGVDGFRCDAGYMIPYPVWEYIVAKVRDEFPDTIFMLEGLGGKPEVMESLLGGAGLDWAYSELFQTYDQNQMERYLPECLRVSTGKGLLVHFAETHDNARLAAVSQPYARFRTALSALLSLHGGFGITNGVEWFADQKIDVHGSPPLNWGNAENQVDDIARLNSLLESHPCFRAGTRVALIHTGHYNSIALLRERPDEGHYVLVVANFNDSRPGLVAWPAARTPIENDRMYDLVSGREAQIERHGDTLACSLSPGEILCLSPRPPDSVLKVSAAQGSGALPEAALRQCFKAKAIEIVARRHGGGDVGDIDSDTLARRLYEDPAAFIAAQFKPGPPPLVNWQWPRDVKRTVMIPPGHTLCITVPHAFHVALRDRGRVVHAEYSLPRKDGHEFALIHPAEAAEGPRALVLAIKVFEPTRCRRAKASILCLADPARSMVTRSFDGSGVTECDPYALCVNPHNTMAQIPAAWGELTSQYDALLAANLHPHVPEDRRVMLTRCRGWLVHRGYSQAITRDCLTRFSVPGDGSAEWQFDLPSGMGRLVRLTLRFRLDNDRDAIVLDLARAGDGAIPDLLDDDEPVSIVLRPDIEDRINHQTTKAYLGPETQWPAAIQRESDAFEFAPDPHRRLRLSAHGGAFTWEPVWTYMVPLPLDADRGGGGMTDLFSPGYFTLNLRGGETARLCADVRTEPSSPPIVPPDGPTPAEEPPPPIPVLDAARQAMGHFLVRRDDSITVMAGFPWFLDWGRDALIALRGMIAAGMHREARDILIQFARLERNGTLPNLIRGRDDSNRDTSDAPLWLFTAVADLRRAGTPPAWLDEPCGERTLHDVLLSIAHAYLGGTSHGIRVDAASGLVFSPAHFTWMDTLYPAGTPREGYPIEIQALWHAALTLLADLNPDGPWPELADRVRRSVMTLFTRHSHAGLADCLHATPGQPAASAVPDDAVRPNQLLAISLGAVVDPELCASILAACEELLIPGAIRSLADRPVAHPLPIPYNGGLLNDPIHPYWGHYRGDEDTRRKPAYHNGTAWTWLFPSYSEALFMTYGPPARAAAMAFLSSSVALFNRGCVGHLPEIADGDSPHASRGCGAQAWGATELYRVIAYLNANA